VLLLFQATVESALVGREGDLTLSFRDGARLRVQPSPDYEAWQISGPDRLLVVCMPGGGEPAIWDEDSPSGTFSS
jgi:Family of unknown function (DUF6188)